MLGLQSALEVIECNPYLIHETCTHCPQRGQELDFHPSKKDGSRATCFSEILSKKLCNSALKTMKLSLKKSSGLILTKMTKKSKSFLKKICLVSVIDLLDYTKQP